MNTKLNLRQEFANFAHSYPPGAMPVPVALPGMGTIGECYGGEFHRDRRQDRALELVMRDERRFHFLVLGQRIREAARLALDMWAPFSPLAAITTWDGVLAARNAGYLEDVICSKASLTTVGAAWSNFYRSTGFPGAGSYTNIPGGAVHNSASAGAVPLTVPGGGRTKYLLNFGANHLSGVNVVLMVDLLVACGNIPMNASPTTINSTALTRYTDGNGVMAILEVTTVFPIASPTMTLTYTGSVNGAGQSSATMTMTSQCAIYRLQPIGAGCVIPLASGDTGVVSVETLTLSATMASGVVALLLYKPLVFLPTLSSTSWVERSVPAALGGIQVLPVGSDSALGCLTFFVLPQSTGTGVQLYQIQTCEG